MTESNGKEETKAVVAFEPENVNQAYQLARTFAASSLLPTPLRGKPADVLIVLMTGRELGLSPMQSIRGLHVIEGKGVMSADTIVGLVKSRADVCEFFRLVESTDKIATYEARRVGDPEPTRLSFTIEQAQRAKLTGKSNWQTYPEAMLRARCSAALARAVFPDLAGGIYTPDEAAEIGGNGRKRGTPEPAGNDAVRAALDSIEPVDVASEPAPEKIDPETGEVTEQAEMPLARTRKASRLAAEEMQ